MTNSNLHSNHRHIHRRSSITALQQQQQQQGSAMNQNNDFGDHHDGKNDNNKNKASSSSSSSASSSSSSHPSIRRTKSMTKQYVVLGAHLFAVSIFILINRFVGPWPIAFLQALKEPYWLLIHYLSATMFAGTIVVSAILENMIVNKTTFNKNDTDNDSTDTDNDMNDTAATTIQDQNKLIHFWFQQVPQMDARLVLPSVVTLLVSGTATAHSRYGGGSLALAPKHITLMFAHLLAFMAWWIVTDITTRSKVLEYYHDAGSSSSKNNNNKRNNNKTNRLQQVLKWRKVSNIGSCLFVLVLFAIMTLKPGMPMI
ncbi:unnamed protein product [Cylindrotheca closterium]|uniref:Uncharacterized protein n=1 Tax=Cylindrotheca closterium TaxID=2856 RepID=A0AAD2FN95_9STRA|nr:unnamed protein product [Cylindrotheca closterium]